MYRRKKEDNPMKRLLLLVPLLLLSMGHSFPQPGNNLDLIVQQCVKNERVDYAQIKDKWADSLDQYLDFVANLQAKQFSGEQLLALHINTYNASMLKAVLAHDIATWKPSDNDFSVFKEPHVKLMGETMSLNDLENKVIRPTFKDPRIHAALVCAAVSCPPLIPRAYVGNDLEEVLEANMKRFVNDPARNRVDEATKTIHLSRIFDWYAEDFGGKDKVLEYVDRCHEADLAGYKVEFLDYDWSLNKAE